MKCLKDIGHKKSTVRVQVCLQKLLLVWLIAFFCTLLMDKTGPCRQVGTAQLARS